MKARLEADRVRTVARHAGDWDPQEIRDELERAADAIEHERNTLIHALQAALFAGVFPPETREAYQSAVRVLNKARDLA